METKKCSVCKQVFLLTSFYLRRDRMKRIARCSSCNRKASQASTAKLTLEQRQARNRKGMARYEAQAQAGNVKRIIQHKMASWKGNAKAKHVPFTLTSVYLIDLFSAQKGKCYYTDETLMLTSGLGRGRLTLKNRPTQFSLDRKIPSLGYVEGNVVWCTWLVNTMKNSLTEEEFYVLCKTVLNKRKNR